MHCANPFMNAFIAVCMAWCVPPLSGATFTVTTPLDVQPAPPGTLRWAIQQANLMPGQDLIDFNIPASAQAVIQIFTPLPPLTDPAGVIIDGLTQPGAAIGPNAPSTLQLTLILDSQIPRPPGIGPGLEIQSNHNVIRGLVIQYFPEDGVLIAGADDNIVEYCIIGLDFTGVGRLGNGQSQAKLYGGVRIEACTGDAERNTIRYNLISDNYAEGVAIWSCPPVYSHENIVQFNYIGSDISGTAPRGNANNGVYIGEGSYNNTVDGNLIGGNHQSGVSIVGYGLVAANSRANIIANNSIGLDAAGNPLPNGRFGVSIGEYATTVYGFASGNQVLHNSIAFNRLAGVLVAEEATSSTNADSNRISQNSMYYNGGLGIDLDMDGITANDATDMDNRANEDCNYPGVTTITHSSGTTTFTGTVTLLGPAAGYVVEIFQAQCDDKGYGEGMTYMGSAVPDAAGVWNCTLQGYAVGDSVTMTCTDFMGNTSEFSKTFAIANGTTGFTQPPAARAPAMAVYPNPGRGAFSVETSFEGMLTVYGLNGVLVYRGHHAAGKGTVQIGAGTPLPPGLYIVRLSGRSLQESVMAIVL